ncbi:hypothetical protein M514_06533 [Trichuris suis]|uniref:Uncharacterized protein n=1 Tax=Trichuris suis TaxID=68888 RepID=A0A085N2W1_9BILA|nr:hypothetical protein M514_06533 [Trichuris suis]
MFVLSAAPAAGQSYAEWIANPRGIGKDCQFLCPDENCGKSYLDSLIRDVLVINMTDKQVGISALVRMSKSYLDSLIRGVLVTSTPDEQVRIAALQQSNPSLALQSYRHCWGPRNS